MRESFPKGAEKDAAEGLHGFEEEGEQAGVPGATKADHGGAAKAVGAQLATHVPVGPLLEVKADQLGAERGTDVMGAGVAVRGVKNVPAAGFEEAVNDVEMWTDIIGVEVLEKLVAEDDIGDACGQVEVVTVIDH